MTRQVFPTVDAAARKAITATNTDNIRSSFQPYYHYQAYAQAGQTHLSFFGTPYTAAPGGFDDTNMLNAGVLNQRSLEVTAIEVLFIPGVVLASDSIGYVTDVQEVFESGRLEFYINSELMLRDGPVGMFASPNRLVAEDVQYAAPVGPVYRVTNVVIPANTSFSVDLKWQSPVGITAEGRIGVRLIGVESRVS